MKKDKNQPKHVIVTSQQKQKQKDYVKKYSEKFILKKSFIKQKSKIGCSRYQPNQSSSNEKYKQKQLLNPLLMDSTMMSYLFMQRVATIVTFLSIIISLVQVYSWMGDSSDFEQTFFILGHGLTLLLALMVIISHHLNREMDIARGLSPSLRIPKIIINIIIIIPHPNQLTPEYNYIFHLLIFLRLSIPFQFIIRSSMYHNSRGNRLIKLYGIDSSTHFFFSMKSIIEGLKLYQIFTIHVIMATIFSHALYLVSAHGFYQGYQNAQYLTFLDCFQIVIVTMPTVGYGQYNLNQTGQRIIIFLIIIFSASFNSFVMVHLLRLLQMSPRQIASYRLQKKIKIKQNIQKISKIYIVQTFKAIKSKSRNNQYRKQLDYTFRSVYRQEKVVYDSLNNNQIDKNFTFFRQSLHDFYIKNIQTNEMINVLLQRLKCLQAGRKGHLSIFSKQRNKCKQKVVKRVKLNYSKSDDVKIKISQKQDFFLDIVNIQQVNSIKCIQGLQKNKENQKLKVVESEQLIQQKNSQTYALQ